MNSTGYARPVKRKWQMIRIIFAIIFALSLTSCDKAAIENQDQSEIKVENNQKTYEKAKFKYAHDGDTIWVYINGNEEKIRFVGVNTPEVARDGNPAEYMADEAKDFTEKTLEDKEIYLEKDETDRDKYDRLLRYIWLEKPITNPSLSDIETKTLNGLLVKEGYAYSNYYKPNIKYQDYLEEIEKSAQENGLGIWSKVKNDGSQKGKIDKSYFIKGNKNSKVYHLPEWDSYNTVKEKNSVYFENEKEAKEAGFRPAS